MKRIVALLCLLLATIYCLAQSRSSDPKIFVHPETRVHLDGELVYPLLDSIKHISDTVQNEISAIAYNAKFWQSIVLSPVMLLGNRDTISFSGYHSYFNSPVHISYASNVRKPKEPDKLISFQSIRCSFIKELNFFDANVYHRSFRGNYDDIRYDLCTLKQYEVHSDTCKNLIFFYCRFNMNTLNLPSEVLGNIEFDRCEMPDTIDFTDRLIKGEIKIKSPTNGKKALLVIKEGFKIQNLKSPYSSFLVCLSYIHPDMREYYLRGILEVQKEIGSSKDIELADIALKDFLVWRGDYILGFQKFLWNYGYNKFLLLQRLLFSFLVFYIINLLLFKRLILEVYIIPNLKSEYLKLSDYRSRRVKYRRFPFIVFLYSCIIFFGWKMDIDKFPFKHLFLSLYLFLFYLIGLGLLFYVLGLLLNK